MQSASHATAVSRQVMEGLGISCYWERKLKEEAARHRRQSAKIVSQAFPLACFDWDIYNSWTLRVPGAFSG